ncbi:hypothetical protein FJ420_14580 [Mesorhizobium sp. B3-1-3]|nr:hypothetical protein FJ424_15095 [Mesorhizobium sp. B3-1-8]TPI71737.1 hypothetical protein FJ420_14580 [Mesorhizobium sp. B3-1-3]TPJ36181.1 hypothetical protein FJ418_03545 [Mesorhizobium sp. B2-8-3]
MAAMANELGYRTARDLFLACPAIARDMKLPAANQPPLEFCRALLAGRVPEEAVTFCAYLLPDRAAVWWGHECLSHLSELLADRDLELLALVNDWVGEPGNPRHRAALSSAVDPSPATPAAWIALSAAWRDPAFDMLSTGFPAAHAVNAGILAGLARVSTADRFGVLSAFVDMGIQMVEMEAQRQSVDAY